MQKIIENLSELKNKKVAVVGFGRSGVSTAKLISLLGAELIINDKKEEDEILKDIDLIGRNIYRITGGGHPPEALEGAELVVVSPGVPLSTPSIISAVYKGIPVIGEIEFSWQIMQLIKDDIKILGITGTNGKSTTSTLTYEFLKKDGRNVYLAGNIGFPMAEVVQKLLNREIEMDYLVLELSSFQLEGIKSFAPDYAAILNITPDHMDRYSGMSEYIKAKAKIFQNQLPDNYLILNMDDDNTIKVIESLRELYIKKGKLPHIFYFSRFQRVFGAYLDNDIIYFNPREDLPQEIFTEMRKTFINISGIKIKGVHNIENIMAASLIALCAGCKSAVVEEVAKEFSGLPHRMEVVREIDGITYINDSKGTNVDAVKKSLESFSGNVILIAGGRDKDGDFTELKEVVSERVKALILIGEARQKIADALGEVVPYYFENDMKSAVIKAKEISQKGDIVLLSPGCASFDMFRNFEHRGEVFKEIVNSL
uniref:UDP-N-acetylmuramoylalanine--D-glutamate ligase n=1 Tax=Thermodesulfovibrio aggregans TaxID=86166 RepID=A0A7C4ELV0_9BACT